MRSMWAEASACNMSIRRVRASCYPRQNPLTVKPATGGVILRGLRNPFPSTNGISRGVAPRWPT